MSGVSYTGKVGEGLALAYLQKKGMQFVAQNVRMAGGEIDLILRDGQTLVFCEVKTRRYASFDQAAGAVDAAKRRRICGAALAYARKYGLLGGPIRFDTLIITGQGERAEITHIPCAFSFENKRFFV